MEENEATPHDPPDYHGRVRQAAKEYGIDGREAVFGFRSDCHL